MHLADLRGFRRAVAHPLRWNSVSTFLVLLSEWHPPIRRLDLWSRWSLTARRRADWASATCSRRARGIGGRGAPRAACPIRACRARRHPLPAPGSTRHSPALRSPGTRGTRNGAHLRTQWAGPPAGLLWGRAGQGGQFEFSRGAPEARVRADGIVSAVDFLCTRRVCMCEPLWRS